MIFQRQGIRESNEQRLNLIKQKYYRKGLEADVEKYILGCSSVINTRFDPIDMLNIL
jgi:hypothetical protein